jgi:5'-deoxynucleotidase YfbR-like HD superfamily hydrolase
MNILELPDEDILEEAHMLRYAYQMKRTLRYNSTRDFSVHSESVAEHVFGLIFLSEYFLLHEKVGSSLDKAKLYQILLYHDFSEIKHGDVVTYHKTQADVDREREDAKEVFASLPSSLQKIGYDSWYAYEHHVGPEAHFAYAIDKIEPLFELLDPVNERSVKDLKITYSMNLTNKLKATAEYPVMKRFTEVVSKDMLDRNVFWLE